MLICLQVLGFSQCQITKDFKDLKTIILPLKALKVGIDMAPMDENPFKHLFPE
jgi:hypothetical protein